MNRDYKIGDYIIWVEDYDDGIAGKDSGSGIIIDTETYPSSYNHDILTTYKVFRNKHKDFCWFENRNIILKQ
jgi:hypothetical protein